MKTKVRKQKANIQSFFLQRQLWFAKEFSLVKTFWGQFEEFQYSKMKT